MTRTLAVTLSETSRVIFRVAYEEREFQVWHSAGGRWLWQAQNAPLWRGDMTRDAETFDGALHAIAALVDEEETTP